MEFQNMPFGLLVVVYRVHLGYQYKKAEHLKKNGNSLFIAEYTVHVNVLYMYYQSKSK